MPDELRARDAFDDVYWREGDFNAPDCGSQTGSDTLQQVNLPFSEIRFDTGRERKNYIIDARITKRLVQINLIFNLLSFFLNATNR